MKVIIYISLTLFFLISCNSFKRLERKAVYFTADNSLFSDTAFPEQFVNYDNQLDIKGNHNESFELLQGNESKVWIYQPTIFRKENDLALIYPNEHILIKGDYDDYIFSTLNKDSQRDQELKIFKVFRQLEDWPVIPRLAEYDLKIVLKLEEDQKEKIIKTEARSQQIFDSLLDAHHVSNLFRNLTKDYVKNRYDVTLTSLYNVYADTLKAHGLYKEKYQQLLPYFNSITDKSRFNSNIRSYLNEVHLWLFQGDMLWSLPNVTEFKKCFDNIENSYTGFARDYLLSRLMWRAYSKGFKIPSGHVKKYKLYSINKDYKKIVARTKHERKRNDRDKKGIKNKLLMADGKTTTTFEEVLAQYKGKFVLIDLWASWCLPCITEIPYLKQLEAKYSRDKIAFIGISMDKQTENWHRGMRMAGLETSKNYFLLNATQTSFYKKYDVNEIPRYMLVGPDGKVINDNTPLPSSPELAALIESYISN